MIIYSRSCLSAFMKRSILLLTIILAMSLVLVVTAYGSQVVINDINQSLSAAEKTSLMKLVEKQIIFHRAHANFKVPVVLNIRLFASAQDYQAYQKQISASTSTSGFYSSKKNELIVNKTKRNYFQILLHESQHAIFRLTGAQAPKWLNEGLSTFFDQTYVDNGVIFIKADKRKAARVKRYLNRNELTPLRKLVALSQKEWEGQFKDKKFKYYDECWSLIYFLVMDKQARQRHDLINILRDLKKGTKGSTLQAINRRYPGGLNALERDWHQFIRNSSFGQKLRYS
jgi:hypothetical protein